VPGRLFRATRDQPVRRGRLPGRDRGFTRGRAGRAPECRRRVLASAVAAAEGLAEWQHRRLREELGLEGERGKRYSPGYSACPDLADQGRIFRLLDPGEIGVTLTSAWQLVPEASTSAIVVHHPAAVYYLVRT
jgi:cobalamin-dependent methionine synthase I